MSGLFKNFKKDESVSSVTQAKSSAQRSIVKQLDDQYEGKIPMDVIDYYLPKKKSMLMAKCTDYITLILAGDDSNEPIFFQQREGPFFPTLKFLHKLNDLKPQPMAILQVDYGAASHILKGADVFVAGLISAGAYIPVPLPANTPVQVMVEGKSLPIAIGITAMSTDEMKEKKEGVGIQIIHHIGDGLWSTGSIE